MMDEGGGRRDEWEPTPWPPDVRACATGDVLPVAWFVFWTALGAAVVAAALEVWVMRKWIPDKGIRG